MATFYRGTEIKFRIDLKAQGFSMDEDDFEIQVSSGRSSVKGYKTPGESANPDLIIFRDPEEGSSDSSSSYYDDGESPWFGIVDTSKLTTGDMRVIGIAHVPDAKANDGIRDDVAVASLGKLQEP